MMDKASLVKLVIEYVKLLQDEEKHMQAEITELELRMPTRTSVVLDGDSALSNDNNNDVVIMPSPIEVLELRVSSMGEKTVVVSITCSKRRDTMGKLCKVFESLNLQIVTANMTAFSGTISKTVFLEACEEEEEVLRSKIEAAIAALNNPDGPISI
ncbi:PREDICTED: transcription factor bHLH35-like isoform X1 [Erythranthe guttata]|nr:PREDICTED: transcription factor bHLH35-like isoform X1 [Erythranthe guttata]|eukprot:XP_012829192.1 PREDICTED: transcription factor bHLH35-like isoform X1 [Erythranthe guttata]